MDAVTNHVRRDDPERTQLISEWRKIIEYDNPRSFAEKIKQIRETGIVDKHFLIGFFLDIIEPYINPEKIGEYKLKTADGLLFIGDELIEQGKGVYSVPVPGITRATSVHEFYEMALSIFERYVEKVVKKEPAKGRLKPYDWEKDQKFRFNGDEKDFLIENLLELMMKVRLHNEVFDEIKKKLLRGEKVTEEEFVQGDIHTEREARGIIEGFLNAHRKGLAKAKEKSFGGSLTQP